MTKQEQIYEMAKYVCNVCDFKCDWFQSGMKEDSICTTAQETAKAIYNAVSNEIDTLKAENKQLKTECALLDDELRIARQEAINVLNELKSKCHNYYPSIDHYCCSVKAVSLSDINELIKEVLNAENKG